MPYSERCTRPAHPCGSSGVAQPRLALGDLIQSSAAEPSSNTSAARSITGAKGSNFPDSSRLSTPSFLRRTSVRSGMSSARKSSTCRTSISYMTMSIAGAEMPLCTGSIHSTAERGCACNTPSSPRTLKAENGLCAIAGEEESIATMLAFRVKPYGF